MAGAAIGFAVAIETAVIGAGTAGLADLFLERLAGAVDTHCGIVRGDGGLVREIVQGAFLDIDDTQGVAILGFESLKQGGDTLADFGAELGRGSDFVLKLLAPGFEGAGSGGAMAVVVDDGVAEDAVEPGDDLFVGDGGRVLESAGEGSLENVFGGLARLDAVLEEGQEIAVAGYELRDCFRGH